MSVGRVVWAAIAATALALSTPESARAQQARPRDRAYYRGRAEAPEPEAVLIWVPRVVFFPAYVVTNYGVRIPVRAVMNEYERRHVGAWLHRILNPTPSFSWAPIFVADLGVLTSGGVRAQWTDALVRGNRLLISASTGGPDFVHVAGEESIHGRGWRVGVRADYLTRPDRAFYGTGPRSEEADRTFFTLTRGEVLGFVGIGFGPHVGFEVGGGYRHDDTSAGMSPSIETGFQRFGVPPGLGALSFALVTASATVDTRHPLWGGAGVRLYAGASFVQDTALSERRFVYTEAELQGAIEVAHPGRLLVGSVYAADVEPLGDVAVPFTHQAMLGWNRHVGFRWGRFRDHSAFVVEIDYRYPIWRGLDAVWLASLGNVFGRHFEDFDLRLLTGSFGFGFRTRALRGGGFEALIGLGTQRIEEGFGFDSFRFYVGLNRGL